MQEVAAAGGWHLDVAERVLSWDETSAHLLGRIGAARHALVEEELAATHPWDRMLVADGFERCIRDAAPHQARFRALTVQGGYTWCVAQGRRIVDVHGKVHLVGFLQAAAG